MKKLLIALSALLLLSQSGFAQTKKTVKKTVTKTTVSKSSSNAGFLKSPKGLMYKIVKHGTGTMKPQVGDFMEFNLTQYVHDSLLFETRKMNNGQAVKMPLKPVNFNGDIAEGFMMMVAGDSAIFRVPVDSIAKMSPQLPPFMHKGDMLEFRVQMVNVVSAAAEKALQDKSASVQKDIDDKILQDYLSKNNIKATKTESGLYYNIEKTGTGDQIKKGQTISINYTGKLLNGNIFDSNIDPKFNHVQPLTFAVGQGQMIHGMDEGAGMLKMGSKATLYLPSTIAYGANSPSPAIPANSVLIFEVEVTEVK
ncbi:MAG: FKBP-type peptidyl-prolyl cis-trans isomerase [Taibaiella sp.]|nr:FKBP-type peptidyl-prolyl cis-trans isomerase [Taibaiella sp.]